MVVTGQVKLAIGLEEAVETGQVESKLTQMLAIPASIFIRKGSDMKRIKVSSDKDINKYVKELIGIGCKIERGSKHWKLSYNNSKKVIIPGTPSDRNSIFSLKREVRRLLRRELETT